MRAKFSSCVSGLIVMGALCMGMGTVFAAETADPSLTAQASQMDSLAASRGETVVSGRISSDFSAFAGSQANADALVNGLHNGSAVSLTSSSSGATTSSATFTPPTGKMGWGNVYISLALAKQQLASLGITQPTAEQLQAAMMGGTVTTSGGNTVTMQGILQMRSQGMGWGQIANSLGFKLGPVISGMKAANSHINAQPSVQAGAAADTRGTSAGAAGRHETGIVTGTGAPAGAARGGVKSGDPGSAAGRGIVTGAGASGAARGAGPGKHD